MKRKTIEKKVHRLHLPDAAIDHLMTAMKGVSDDDTWTGGSRREVYEEALKAAITMFHGPPPKAAPGPNALRRGDQYVVGNVLEHGIIVFRWLHPHRPRAYLLVKNNGSFTGTYTPYSVPTDACCRPIVEEHLPEEVLRQLPEHL
jgi:hypothetical protein